MGHKDLMRNIQRALRRVGVPIAYSQGFNPHPRMSFASPLAVGATGLRELMSLDLTEEIKLEGLCERLNMGLPEGIVVEEVWQVPVERGTFGTYLVSIWAAVISFDSIPDAEGSDLESLIKDILDAREFFVERRDGQRRDIHALVKGLHLEEIRKTNGLEAVIIMNLVQDGDLCARPQDVLGALINRAGPARVVSLERRDLITEKSKEPDVSRTSGVKSRSASGDMQTGERG